VINPSADIAFFPNKVSAINANTTVLANLISFLSEQLCSIELWLGHETVAVEHPDFRQAATVGLSLPQTISGW
jgi:hypothetical protein